MRLLLSTTWLQNLFTGSVPPDFYLEIRGITPGGKRTQFSYIGIQDFAEQCGALIAPANAAQLAKIGESGGEITYDGQPVVAWASTAW